MKPLPILLGRDLTKMANEGLRQEPIFYAVHQAGEIVHVCDVQRGKAANCRCAKCDQFLVAVQGSERIHHFRHESDIDCVGGNESAIHLFAKEVICRRKTIALPAFDYIASDLSEHHLTKSGILNLDNARAEVTVGSRVVDVLATRAGRDLAIEIFRTHMVDEAKTDTLKLPGTSTLEIDLSALRHDVLPRDLEQQVLFDAPRTWLHNQSVADAIARIESQIVHDVSEGRDPYTRYKERIVREIERIRPIKLLADNHTFVRPCFAEFINIRIPGDYSIAAANSVWQYLIMRKFVLEPRFVKGEGQFTTREVIMSVRKYFSRILNRDHPGLFADRLRADLKPEFELPGAIVIAYLSILERAELILKGYDQVKCRPVWCINRATLNILDPVKSSPTAPAENSTTEPQHVPPSHASDLPPLPAEYWRRKAMQMIEPAEENMRGRVFLMSYHPVFKSRPYDYIVDEQTLGRVRALLMDAIRRR